MYPPNLSCAILQSRVTPHISFLDVFMVTVHPLRYTVFRKPIHSVLYVPWHPNSARNVKEGWVAGECIGFVCLSSHKN